YVLYVFVNIFFAGNFLKLICGFARTFFRPGMMELSENEIKYQGGQGESVRRLKLKGSTEAGPWEISE
ncbi:MAG: hypothetical protein KBD85_04945, partial [Elusimicrobia bacterium]|nr:hypothetical protein [Elusimicrobiota bacterium]